MRRCEVCGTTFGGDEVVCPRDNVALVNVERERSDLRTAFLGRYDPYEADLVVEILTGEGIIAMTKINRTDPNFTQYGPIATDQGVVMVDVSRIDDARTIVAEELPKQLEAIAQEMETLGSAMDDPGANGGPDEQED